MTDQVYAGLIDDTYYLSSRGVAQVSLLEDASRPLQLPSNHQLYSLSSGLYYDGHLLSQGGSSGIQSGFFNLKSTDTTFNTGTLLNWAINTSTTGVAPISIATPTRIAAVTNGLYSMVFIFEIILAASPGTVDMEPFLIVSAVTTAAGTFTTGEFHERLVAKGSDPGADNRAFTVSCTQYLAAGDYLTAIISNLGTTDVTITNAYCIVSKLS